MASTPPHPPDDDAEDTDGGGRGERLSAAGPTPHSPLLTHVEMCGAHRGGCSCEYWEWGVPMPVFKEPQS